MHRYMTDLGLSPASRSRVSAVPLNIKKPWEFGMDGTFG